MARKEQRKKYQISLAKALKIQKKMKGNTAVSLTNFNLQRPATLLSYSPDIRHRVGQVRGEWPVDVGLQL